MLHTSVDAGLKPLPNHEDCVVHMEGADELSKLEQLVTEPLEEGILGTGTTACALEDCFEISGIGLLLSRGAQQIGVDETLVPVPFAAMLALATVCLTTSDAALVSASRFAWPRVGGA